MTREEKFQLWFVILFSILMIMACYQAAIEPKEEVDNFELAYNKYANQSKFKS